MSLGNLFSSFAPMAVGAMFPVGLPALAAGAATGAAIAGARGQDPLAGAFTGGISGYGGGNLGAGLKQFGTEQAMQQATAGGVAPQATLGQGITAAVSKPMDFLRSMGGGDALKGGIKTAAAAGPGLAGAMVPDMNATTAEMNQYKYDPNRRLNLNRDTGLRLLAEGGYLETGGKVGDGMSDEIMGTIDNTQPVRLSDGEFVIPADVVSGLGNGSSDAGAEQLYNMMDRVRKARTGTEKMGREITAERLMPA
jgi:hypothetical protein